VSDSEDADTQRPWRSTSSEYSDTSSGIAARLHKANEVDFSLDGPTKTQDLTNTNTGEPTLTTNVVVDEDDRQPSDLAELHMVHHQYGHVSMRKLQEMARQGTLPKRLATCRVPTCSAYLYSKATRRPWRGKTSKSGKEGEVIPQKPGQIVSVDQLVSPTPGLIAQISGFLTTKRYKYATIYVDQYSRMGFVYLQKTASKEETVESKKAFEAFARRHGIQVSNYHADNGIFKAHQWMEACRQDLQGLTFAGVNAHHQNGHAERRIRELQEMARAMMIYANARWKESVTPNLWHYAVRDANEAINHTPSFQDPKRRTPIDLFAGTKISSNPKHWKPFGSPVYVLENELQGRRPFHKWQRRSKPGIYLGRSPQHGRNVSLVLSRETGLVSPQFHVAFDPTIDTVKDITTNSMWQIRAGFVSQREHATNPGTNRLALDDQRTTRTEQGERSSKATASQRKDSKSRKRKRTADGTPGARVTKSSNTATHAAANIGGDGPTIPRNQNEVDIGKPNETVTRSGRKAKPAPRLIEAMAAEITSATSHDVEGEIHCYVAMFPDDDKVNWDNPLLAYKATSDPDTLYYHQAMKEQDKEEL
jgi:hypothetical protein